MDPLIQDAFHELDKLEDTGSRESALTVILRVLIHGEPEVVRSHIPTISQPWPRYLLWSELCAAHGEESDMNSLKAVVPDKEFPDQREIASHIDELRFKIGTGWRSEPDRPVLTSSHRVKMLARSSRRVVGFQRLSAPPFLLFDEMCLRITYGDAAAVAKARGLATDAEMRDMIVASVAKAHAHNGSPVRARKTLGHVAMPENRISVMTLIACVECELGMQQPIAVQH
ncbi:hypothetical protein IPH19_00350 [Candidatus Uhrbacteria bacterium]|nr:MAG: hypothetical protein IPH19_00350 [Candidatus Uhrbacteria bacterium]